MTYLRRLAAILPVFLLVFSSLVGLVVTTETAEAVGSQAAPEFVAGIDSSGQIDTGTSSAAFTVFNLKPGLIQVGDYMYVTKSGNATDCSNVSDKSGCEIQIYDMSDPSNPVFTTGIDTSGAINSGTTVDGAIALANSGDYLYVSKWGNATDCSNVSNKSGCELQIYNISNPAAPTFVAGIDASGAVNSGTSSDYGGAVSVIGNYLYTSKQLSSTACGTGSGNQTGCETRIYNISNPAAPTFVAGIDASGNINSGTSANLVNSHHVYEDHLYLLTSGNGTNCNTSGNKMGCELQIYNISNPAAPTFVAGIDASGNMNSGTTSASFYSAYTYQDHLFISSDGSATDCSTSGNKAGCEIHIYDISTPSSTSFVSGIDASATVNGGVSTGTAYGLSGYGEYIYVAYQSSASDCGSVVTKAGCETKIYNISSPAAPTFVAGMDASGAINSGTTPTNFNYTYATSTHVYTVNNGSASSCANTSKSGCEIQIYAVSPGPEPVISGPTADEAVVIWSGAEVDWSFATLCEYSWDNSTWETVDCDAGGSDIIAPDAPGEATLYVRATTSSLANTDSITFSYNPDTTDLNDDGIPDVSQDYVSGYTSPITGKSVAIDVGDSCELQVDDMVRESNLSVQDSGFDYDNGLFDFEADCTDPSTTAKLYFYGVSKDDLVVRKYNPNTNAYFNLTGAYGATLEESIIDGQTVTIAAYQITDGGDLDMDGLVNGTIVDPVGLARTIVGSPNTGLNRVY